LKIITPNNICRRIAGMPFAETPPPVTHMAIKGTASHTRFPIGVLGYRYADDLDISDLIFINFLWTLKRYPRPSVFPHGFIGPLRFAIGEKLLKILAFCFRLFSYS